MYYIVNPTIKTKRISRRKVKWFELRYSCDGLQILGRANGWMAVNGCFDGVDSKEGGGGDMLGLSFYHSSKYCVRSTAS